MLCWLGSVIHGMRSGGKAPRDRRTHGVTQARVVSSAQKRARETKTTATTQNLESPFVWGCVIGIAHKRIWRLRYSLPIKYTMSVSGHAALCPSRRPAAQEGAVCASHTPVSGKAPFLLSTTNAFSRAMYPFIKPCKMDVLAKGH